MKKVIQVWSTFAVLAVIAGLVSLQLRNYPPNSEIDTSYHVPTIIVFGWICLSLGVALLIGLPFVYILYQRKLINEQICRINRGRLICHTWGIRPRIQLLRRKR